MNTEAVFVKTDNCVERELEDEYLIIPLCDLKQGEEDALYVLNEEAFSLLRRIDGKKNIRQLMGEIQDEWDVAPEILEKEVGSLIEQWVERKIIEAVSVENR